MQMRIITIYAYNDAESAMHAISTTSPDSYGTSTPMPHPADARAAHVDLDSRRLFNGTVEVRIHHGGEEYRLRQTRNGKLILTK
jgi:hemin uptake protein HemP